MEQEYIQGELFNDSELNNLQQISLEQLLERYKKYIFVHKEWDKDLKKYVDKTYIYIPESEKDTDDGIFCIDVDSRTIGKVEDSYFFEEEIEELIDSMTEEQQKEFQSKNKEAHERADLPYFENPTNDNQLLLNYQYLFLRNNDKKAWGDLLSLAYTVTQRLLWKWLKEHKDVYVDKYDQSEKIDEAIWYVLRRYKTRIGWYVSKNFISALKGGVKHAMLYCTELDKNTIITDDLNILKGK